MHDVLEQVIERLGRAVTPESLPDALEFLDEVLAESSPRIAAGRPEGVRAAALRAIEADLRRYLEHEASDGNQWEPRALELRFGFEGEEGSLPALELAQRPGTVRVRGAIDRVDVDPGRDPGDRPRLQERQLSARLPGRPLARRAPAAGGAVHDRGARADGARAGGRVCTSR